MMAYLIVIFMNWSNNVQKRVIQIIISGAFLFLATRPCLVANDKGQNNPLEFPIKVVLPDARMGEISTRVLKGKNVTDEMLTLKKLRSSCGCTSAKLDKKVIKPGEEVTLTVKTDTNQRIGNIV